MMLRGHGGSVVSSVPCVRRVAGSNPTQAHVVGRGGALVETITFNRRIVGSTPALAAT